MEVFYPVVKREKLECGICEKKFVNQQGLSNHVKIHSRKQKEHVLCEKCSRTFRDKYSLRIHIETYHENPKKKAVNCGLCGADSVGRLDDHFVIAHNITVEKECLEFENMKEFFIWKEDIEKATSSHYVKFRGSREDKFGNKTSYFNCHRRGFYNSRGTKKRQPRVCGSNKINGYCPATIALKESVGKLSVVYSKTHVGHSTEIERLRLTKAEKDFVAEKLANNYSVNDILKEVKDSASDDNFCRLHLLSRKDIHNIAAAYKLNIPKCKKKLQESIDQSEDSLAEEELVADELLLGDNNTEVVGSFIEIPVKIEMQSETEHLGLNFLIVEEVEIEAVNEKNEVLTSEYLSNGKESVQVNNVGSFSILDDSSITDSQQLVNENQVEQQVYEAQSKENVTDKECNEEREENSFDEIKSRVIVEFTKIVQLADTKEKLEFILNQISPLPEMMRNVDVEKPFTSQNKNKANS